MCGGPKSLHILHHNADIFWYLGSGAHSGYFEYTVLLKNLLEGVAEFIIEPSHEIMVLFVPSSNVHAQPSTGAMCLMFGRTFHLFPYFIAWASANKTVKALVRLRRCAGSPEPSLVAYVINSITGSITAQDSA